MNGMIWLGILVVMLVIEVITMGLTTIWFAGGALIAFFASLLGAGVPIQVVLFVVVSVALLALTRPYAKRYFNKDRIRTNAESLIGVTGIVLEDIDNLIASGRVQVHGQEWTARTLDDDTKIAAGQEIVVQEIHGVKLMVAEKITNKDMEE